MQLIIFRIIVSIIYSLNTTKMKNAIGFLVLFLLFISITTIAQDLKTTLEITSDSLFQTENYEKIPGAAVLVIKDGEVLLRKGYGLANLEHQVPISSSTVFDIASVSKQFAAMAIAMLVDEGNISLEDDVRTYIPELPDLGHKITIDHLVHHTSGLRDWPGTLALAGWDMEDVISFDQILRMAFHQQALNFEPGSTHVYSNTGYNVLAEIIQRVSGQSFRVWTDQHIFKPLGMKDTHFHDDHQEVIQNRAYGYYQGDSAYKRITNGLTALGSSSLFTTIDDLGKWVINFDQQKVGNEVTFNTMKQKGVLNNGEEINYAFGLVHGEYKGLPTLSHGGSWAAFRTFLLYFPEQKCSIIVLMNHAPSNPNYYTYQLAEVCLKKYVQVEEDKETEEDEKTEIVSIDDDILKEYVGMYKLGPAWYVTISKEKDQLITQATDEDAFPMTALSDSIFKVEGYGGRTIAFKRGENGLVSHFIYNGMTCPKLEGEGMLDDAQLASLTGTYWSDELNTLYKVGVEKGILELTNRNLGTISLLPAWKDDFRGNWFASSVEFIRDEEGKGVEMMVTNYRSRNQRFVRFSKAREY